MNLRLPVSKILEFLEGSGYHEIIKLHETTTLTSTTDNSSILIFYEEISNKHDLYNKITPKSGKIIEGRKVPLIFDNINDSPKSLKVRFSITNAINLSQLK